MSQTSPELATIYRRRFSSTAAYRRKVWSVLTRHYFSRWIPVRHAAVLDLGCGYGEFINQIQADKKYAMDLNTDSAKHLAPDVKLLCQDCAAEWPLPENSLDVVFSSNFFEHLPTKVDLLRTIRQALRCLKPGGCLIALGPNIKYLPGCYWDFFDHYTILTEASLGEALEISGFELEQVTGRFLPYTIVNARQYPLWVVRLYLAMPWSWRIFGRQFLVVARKPKCLG